MNRRDILKALAGIPLLGLLVKLPKVAEPTTTEALKEIVDREEWGPATFYLDVSDSSVWHTMTYEGNGLIHDDGVVDSGQPSFSITVDGVDISEHVALWNDDCEYTRGLAMAMGRAARQTLEKYIDHYVLLPH